MSSTDDIAPDGAGAPPGPDVLVVDDMAENLAVLGEILGGAGYGVRVARSGAVALRLAAQEPVPELVLLDIMMPDMDGYEVLAHLRAGPTTAEIPVVFLTALDDPDAVAKGLRAGAADYIAKPVQPEVVLARVRTQIEAARARRWLRDQNALLEAEVARRLEEIRKVRSRAEQEEAEHNRQRELILTSAAEGIFGVDRDGVINFVNPAAAAMLGYRREELTGRSAHDILKPPPGAGEVHSCGDCPVHVSCAGGVDVPRQERMVWRKDGSSLALEFSATPILRDGRPAGAVVTLLDISERKRYLEQLERKSNFDDLTGLPNRNLLQDRLSHLLDHRRGEGEEVAVLMLNLDRFKSLNDTLGRGAGDQVLQEMARRLGARVRRMDTLARLGSDEFVIVAEAGESEVAAMVKPLLATLEEPFLVAGREFFLTGSIGIAIHPRDGAEGEILLQNAAAAMYRAKAAGGDRFQFYAAEMNARSLERLDMENGLRRAIDRDELVLHYQPQVNLRTGEIIGAEALVRWLHPEKGLVMPGDFIPLAEESGLIVPLGDWVMRRACAQNKAWQDEGLPPVTVAVNLSARQFAAQDVVQMAGAILAETGLAPNYLELELTESAVMADADAFIHATERLKGLSITLSIDDFGTGFSSLSHLRRFAIDRLKIDQSFVRDVATDPNSAAIALAVISLAHSLKLSAIAEGVETEAQLNFLRARGCDEMQGFHFSRPVPAADFGRMLRERRKLALSADVPAPGRTLLIVDDESGILSSLRRLFRREGYNLLTAESGMAGLEVLAGTEVGVVISDARMPGMSGGEFLGKVRELHPDTVRMMLSGYTDLKAVTSAVNRGELFCFLTKPWDDAELLETVRDAFRHYEQRHQLRMAGRPDAGGAS